jgi:hypothetical protein
VTGTLDLDLSGAVPVILGYVLDVILPHGLPTGHAALYPSAGYPNPGPTASLTMTPSGGVGNMATAVLINIYQEFLFDTRFGLQPPNMVYYYPNDATLYPFLMNVRFQVVDGAGPNGTPAYQVRRLQMLCNETQLGFPVRNGCNGYSQNYGFWNANGNSGLPNSITTLGTVPTTPVPLPAGLPLALSGLAVLGFLRRRAA